MTSVKSPKRRVPRQMRPQVRSQVRPRVAPLSQTAEYALRALSQLAAYQSDPGCGALTAKEIARLTLVPSAYLSKILRTLVASGLLLSQKGHGGGFVLARAPTRIRLSDVLDAVDEMPKERRCAFGWGNCDAARPCPLHPAWSRLNEVVRDWATSTTLAEVAGKVSDC